jgi:uncharacterized membrane protein YfcA
MRFEARSAADEALHDPTPSVGAVAVAPTAGKARSQRITLNTVDRCILGLGGIFAGVIAVAIGEITNTFLQVRKKVPPKVATGTAALVLHVTILAALATNLAIIFGDVPYLEGDQIVIPWTIAFILAPVVVVGGQIGSFINSRLSDRTLVRALTTAYVLVGLVVLFNVMRQMSSA